MAHNQIQTAVGDDIITPPPWLGPVRERIVDWVVTVMDPRWPGLFRMSTDAFVVHDLQSSAKALGLLIQHGGGNRLPGADSLAATVQYVQSLQDTETGFFRDPLFEAVFPARDDPQALLKLRRANAKWARILLKHLGSEPLRPFFRTGSGGSPEPEKVLAMIRDGDWRQPWGIGSHAAQAVRELYLLGDQGRPEYFPYVERGIELILRQQNPRTGMWGDDSVPLFQQISGALKVIGNFQFSLGITVPHLQQLADSCVEHHADGSFYAESDSHCIPRNVAEMAIVCLLHSQYRADELRATLVAIAEHYYRIHGKPDGGFSATPAGTEPFGWNGTILCPESQAPRSSVSGTNGSGCLGMIADALGWDVGLPSMHRGWEERVAQLNHRIVLDASGGARIEVRQPG
ncbi:MAG: hypothetical protein HOH74_06050 [Gemmatimonadetes bacterium]|jgi:hypothetical protein|nr:hypothetical protein [Gemmatimonadota bacterium]